MAKGAPKNHHGAVGTGVPRPNGVESVVSGAGDGAAARTGLDNVTEHTSVLLAHCSRDLRYLFVNRATAEFFGRQKSEITGRRITDILGKKAFETIRPYVERVLAGEAVDFETEIPY